MTDLSAELQTEIRRLRMRIIGLNQRRLDQIGGQSETEDRFDRPAGPESSRRETITAALAEFSAIASDGREVPDLGDGSLADQVVVLLDHGQHVAEALPEAERDQMLTRLLDAAVGLRRGLA
ncbi:hypothetical protein [Brevibacterium sp. SMBL_HHYL_HB1]|uniref:hypothetical protein n=1 Tax=Brevibacterium sp. SMBL_HHYL_HB1 TaxID=2777556 RepID=UPI001BAA3AD1|nr:hypothetical protein [Brevibacterium sp. SMBL_HHYL_HB1]QUL77817.1 hypothetical protein IG171_09805 [Brevibacterium sp. SMBL_HHYL_HB1]